MSEINFEILTLLKNKKDLTFLVGAGCSRDPPSCLPLGKKIKNEILEYVCTKSEILNMKNLKGLRFEALMEIIQSCLDNKLKILDFLGKCEKPNLQHFFFSNMIIKGNFVVTTNFDSLIESALLKLKVPKEEIIPVITKDEFEKYENPFSPFNIGKKCVYKIHGSIKNIISGKLTKGSLIVTLKALGRNKEGKNLFQIEQFKQELFRNITKDRILVVIGYSGYDDFDIIPTLKVLNNLKGIIWINHINDSSYKGEITEIEKEKFKTQDKKSKVNRILNDIKKMNYVKNVYRIDINTLKLIKNLIDIKPTLNQENFNIEFKDWLNKVIKPPSDNMKSYLVHTIYYVLNKYDDAIRCGKPIIQNQDNNIDLELKRIIHNNFGIIYNYKADYETSFRELDEALKIAKKQGKKLILANIYANIGANHETLGDFDDALYNYEKALKINHHMRCIEGKAHNFNNIGLIYTRQEKYPKALLCFKYSLRLQEKLGILNPRVAILLNIARINYHKDKLDDTLEILNESYKISDLIGNLSVKAQCLTFLGLIYLKKKDYIKSIKFQWKALILAHNLEDYALKAGVLRSIGGIYNEKNKISKAIDYFTLSLDMLNKIGLEKTPEARSLKKIIYKIKLKLDR